MNRAPSRTAVLVCQGRALADGRYAVGRFADPVARDLLDPAERSAIDAAAKGAGLTSELLRRAAVMMVPRTVAIDDAIRAHGARQLVVLGAGLDTRAWRMPELADVTVFEVDHPASQRDKLRRVGDRVPVARAVRPVPVDLAVDPLGPPLRAAGLDPTASTTWVWEGVIPYLTATEVAATLRAVAELSAPGDVLVANYQARSRVVTVMRPVMRLLLRVTRQQDPMAGEPWRSLWTPAQLRELLAASGFAVRTDDDLLTLAAGLDLPAGNAGSLRNGRVAVAVC